MSAESIPTERTSTPQDPLLGTTIAGRYRIDHVHDRGGMSVVYAAHYEAQQRDVAIKVLDEAAATNPEAVERFMHEAQTASSMSHGHVVGVSEFGMLPSGRPYLVMPMIAGKDLATLISEQGPLSPTRVAALLVGVASALDAMHERGLVHRDIKSENIMYVRDDNGTETALVLDFGIAAAPTQGDEDDADDMSGTPEFMAPEALAGEPTDHRADVYSLATVAFELLSGSLPFEGNDLPDLLRNKAMSKPRTLSEASGVTFPSAIEDVLARGLAKSPNARPSSAGRFVQQLSGAASRTASQAPMLRVPAADDSATKPKRMPRLRTLVGMPVTGLPTSAEDKRARQAKRRTARLKPSIGPVHAAIPQTNAPVRAASLAPVREPSIVVDAALLAPRLTPPPPAGQPRQDAQPVGLTPPTALDSLKPIAVRESEPEIATPRPAWLRIGAPVAAAALVAIALWSRSGDAPSTVAPVEPKASTASAPIAAPAPAPAPVAAPAPVVAPASAPLEVAPAPEPAPAPVAAPVSEARPAKTTAKAKKPPRAQASSAETKASPVSVPAKARVDAQAVAEQAVNAMLRGDFADSLAGFQQAIDANPRFAAAHRGKGLVLERLGRRKEAASAFKQYLRLSPNAPDTEKIRGRLEALEQ